MEGLIGKAGRFYKALAGFDLVTLELQSPRWQAETMPLDHVARASKV
jgi:hypothetical protein